MFQFRFKNLKTRNTTHPPASPEQRLEDADITKKIEEAWGSLDHIESLLDTPVIIENPEQVNTLRVAKQMVQTAYALCIIEKNHDDYLLIDDIHKRLDIKSMLLRDALNIIESVEGSNL